MKPAPARKPSRDTGEDKIRRLERMLEATKSLSSTLDVAKLTAIILRIVRQEVPVDRVTAFMIDRKAKVLRSVVAQGVTDSVIRLPIGVGVAGTVAQSGETLDIPDAYKDTRFHSGVDRVLGYHTKDIFCLPIPSRNGDVIGVLELQNRTRPIDDFDQKFLSDISVHVGLALELAWSHREVLEKEKLEQEMKGLRERLVQLDRMRLIGELFGSVIHELNNPLAVLAGNVELLKIQLEAEGHSKPIRYLDTIEAAAHRSAATARKFLKLIQSPPRRRRPLNLPELIRLTLALRQYEWKLAGIQVDDRSDNVPSVVANEDEIQHVFLNILKNAEEAVTGYRRKARIEIRCSYDSASQRVRVDIADNGPGIPPEAHTRIFGPFFTTKTRGKAVGLGLTIARRIIEEHEGHIFFETKTGIGTTFTIELPCASE